MAARTILAGYGLAGSDRAARYMRLRYALDLDATRARKKAVRAAQDAMSHIDPDVDPDNLEAGGLTAEDVCEVRRGLERIEARLDERRRYALLHRLAGDRLHEIGEDMNLSKERVRQLEASALREIAAPVNPLDTRPIAR